MTLRTDRELPERCAGLQETGVDFAALRRERLGRIQREMARQSVAALLLTDPIHIRFATGLSVMPLWTAVNYARYVVVPADGDPSVPGTELPGPAGTGGAGMQRGGSKHGPGPFASPRRSRQVYGCASS